MQLIKKLFKIIKQNENNHTLEINEEIKDTFYYCYSTLFQEILQNKEIKEEDESKIKCAIKNSIFHFFFFSRNFKLPYK